MAADERSPLVARYRFERIVEGTEGLTWIARDEATGRRVVASLVDAPRAKTFEALVGFAHPHVAMIWSVVAPQPRAAIPADGEVAPGSKVVLAEYVGGRTLAEELGVARPPRDGAVHGRAPELLERKYCREISAAPRRSLHPGRRE